MTATAVPMTVKPGWQGRHFEDFEVGDLYQHPLGRTITDADNTWFSLLTMNTAEPHFNAEVGKASEFGRSLVASSLTLAIASGQTVIDTSQNAMANLGWDKIRLPTPVFVGDTLWSESLVLAKRESSSRRYAGIVSVKTRTINQHGHEVLSFVRTFYVYKAGATQKPQGTRPTPTTPFTVTDDEQP